MQTSRFAGFEIACLRGQRLVFADLDFTLGAGDALVLAGPNGAGKSSLLRLMAGLIRPMAGRLEWDGTPIAADPDAHRARTAYLGHADAVKPVLTAAELVRFWAGLAGAADPDAAAADALDRAGIGGLAAVQGRYLSAGQKRRVALARIFASPAPLWLLDEPTVALDDAARARLEAELARHRAGGGLVVLSTHAPVALPDARRLDIADYAAADWIEAS